jgi:hypothetical protein
MSAMHTSIVFFDAQVPLLVPFSSHTKSILQYPKLFEVHLQDPKLFGLDEASGYPF